VLPPPRVERIALPPVPPVSARVGFPVAASLAPVLVSVGIWAMTGSPYSLLFAFLGPVVALGSLLDGRRQRRRTVRRDRERALAAVARARVQVESAHTRERARLDSLAPVVTSWLDARRVVERWSGESPAGVGPELTPLAVRVGRAELGAVVELSGDVDDDAPAAFRDAIAELRNVAEHLQASPWLVDARDGIGVLGPPAATRAVARSLAVQLLAQCSPASGVLTAPLDEGWVAELPHRTIRSGQSEYRLRRGVLEVVIAWARESAELSPGLGSVIRLAASPHPGDAEDRTTEPRDPVLVTLGMVHADAIARQLAELARQHGVIDPATMLPAAVSLREVLDGDRGDPYRETRDVAGPGLRAPIGLGADGVVELDLASEGPHAVVAGTTGSGKSELLVSWVLAMASRHPPSVVTFLLIDFKGGAAFAPLAELPHVVGIVSDLDARRSRRAIESLRAELRRRELLLAERGARSIEELPGELARLVIVVDEFAAVVSGQPELHEVFADLAARGRSLGLHLVLCTQRPAGVIRDGVLANVALRISLRVTDRSDSMAMLGSDAAFALPPTARGRAVIADGSGLVREVQLALAEPDDAERIRGLSPGLALAPTPVWCDPLPEVLRLELLRLDPAWGVAPGIPFGRLDLPAEQRQPLAVLDLTNGGHLLVLGAARAGRTTTLAAFAADPRCRVLPSDPADAWTVLEQLAVTVTEPPAHPESAPRTESARRTVLLVDDLDVLIDRVDPDARLEFVDRLARLARESRALTLVVSAQRITAPLQRLAGLFEARLLLRQPSRDEHVLAGGDGAAFDARLPPGAGSWRLGGSAPVTVQVAIGDQPLPAAEVPELPRVRPEPGTPCAVVAGRPRELLRMLEARAGAVAAGPVAAGRGGTPGMRVIRVGEEHVPDDGELRVTHGEPIVLLGDPDAWQAEWALLSAVRREFPVAFSGCTAAELRSIARIRETPPPLGDRQGECWLVDGGEVRRAILEL